MKVSILIPCFNEEKSIEKCVLSCLNQSRKPDQIVVVDDSSTDKTPDILARYRGQIKIVRTLKRTGKKSSAQEYGLKFIEGDIFVVTDGDTVLHKNFIKNIIKGFNGSNIVAVSGYVKSIKYNWLTACRAFEYSLGQNVHKLAQSFINYLFVIPGAAGAFEVAFFKKYLSFEHDTLTEDLDFTYKIHKAGKRIGYRRDAIVYTQDPPNIRSYINQMRRWYGGGWQNLIKHLDILEKPAQALELSVVYIEGLIFSILLMLLPIINIKIALYTLGLHFVITALLSVFTAIREKRADLLMVPFFYYVPTFVNAWVFLEQFIKEVILRRKNLVWFTPDRIKV